MHKSQFCTNHAGLHFTAKHIFEYLLLMFDCEGKAQFMREFVLGLGERDPSA